MAASIPAGRRQQGIAYLALLITLAITGIGLSATGSFWVEVSQREKEKELLFIGDQFRRAIQQYYENGINQKKYPPTLEALLVDPRYPGTRRYLRRIYRDPMTGTNDWEVIRATDGGIMGIHSSRKDLLARKKDNFPKQFAAFGNKDLVSDWWFTYEPAR